MDELEKSRTLDNLEKAFAEEARLVFRYLYYATIAEFEGRQDHARAFKELAESGSSGVHGCFDFLRLVADPDSGIAVGGTPKNLESLLQTEARQHAKIYPEMAKVARQEGFPDIASWFETLEKSKRSNVRKLRKLADG